MIAGATNPAAADLGSVAGHPSAADAGAVAKHSIVADVAVGAWLTPLTGHWTAAAYAHLSLHPALVRVTVLVVRGSGPREPGASMLVDEHGTLGTIGGGRLEWLATGAARDLLHDRNAAPVRILDWALGPALGQCCGGRVELWLERLTHDDLSWLETAGVISGRPIGASPHTAGKQTRPHSAGSHTAARETVGRRTVDRRPAGAELQPAGRAIAAPQPNEPQIAGRSTAGRLPDGRHSVGRRTAGRQPTEQPAPELRLVTEVAGGRVSHRLLRSNPGNAAVELRRHPSTNVSAETSGPSGSGPSGAGPLGALPLRVGPSGSDPSVPGRSVAGSSGGDPSAPGPRKAGQPEAGPLHLQATLLEVVSAGRPQLWIFGAGHVGQALVRMLSELSLFDITWIDSRHQLLPAGLPDCVRTRAAADPAGLIGSASPATHFVVLTHDHGLDYELCRRVLARGDAAWLGLIGSASKAARFRSRLVRDGVERDRLGGLTCPIGVRGIASKVPAAIAIAIAAELLQRHGAAASSLNAAAPHRLAAAHLVSAAATARAITIASDSDSNSAGRMDACGAGSCDSCATPRGATSRSATARDAGP
jgi:xanthine/CO dehydrogenase XdhC/CoxF family maturation factor